MKNSLTVTISDSIALFHNYIANERRLAIGTVHNYDDDLHDFSAFLEENGVKMLDDLSTTDIREWQMMHLKRGDVPGTLRRRLSTLSSWCRFLRRRGLLERDIMASITPPRMSKRLPIFFRENELEHLYDGGLFPDDLTGQRDALMLRMLYETGVRRSELAGLRMASVDLSARMIKVLGKRNKERLIPIEEELMMAIQNYVKRRDAELGPSEWLFVRTSGKPISPDDVYRVVKRYMPLLSNADRISPHVFRHSFATHLLNEGGNIQAISELLGHADLSTTEIYTHLSRTHLKEVYKKAHPRGW